MPALHIHGIGPGVTVQDLGRPGWTARGLPVGGAADPLALYEMAALLGTKPGLAVLEIMGLGGTFTTDYDTRIALTGAKMQANVDGTLIAPNRTHLLRAGARLTVGGARAGIYGYLGFVGGIDTPVELGSRAAHLTAGIGRLLCAGDTLPLGVDSDPMAGPTRLDVVDRLGGGTIRIMPGPQTDYFAPQMLQTFGDTSFTRSTRGNRQGVRLDYDGPGFVMAQHPNIVSDLILPGDVQMTGDGVPYVLLAECQTIGGYPRIGTVIPSDLPKIAQAGPGATLTFEWLTVEQADATAQAPATMLQSLRGARAPLTRDPHDIADLLRYQLISGATPGDDLDRA